DTEFGEIFTKWPIDPRAIVQVVQVPGASGPNKVLRISDALIQDGTAHSEVTMRPVGAHGSVTVRFELRVVDLAGDSMRLTIVDNRTTPGTGRLAGLTIRPDGKVLAGSMPLPLVLKPGDFYRFAYVFELAGSADTYSLSIHPAAGTGAGGVELKDVPIPVDSVTVTDMTFTMSDEGTGAVELDNVRVLN